MDKFLFESVCAEYKNNYAEIFKTIYPAKNSTGFTERNLSVNFSRAYEKVISKSRQTCITWYEFQFGIENNKHYDALIINTATKEILIIESKRYNDIPRKIKSVIKDIKRINNFSSEIANENFCRIADFSEYKIYGIILADIWTQNTSSPKQKLQIQEQYRDNCFVNQNEYLKNESAFTNMEFMYNVQSFDDCTDCIKSSAICHDYYLLTMIWEVSYEAHSNGI